MDKRAELRTTYQVAKLGTVRAQSSPSRHCASMAAFASSYLYKKISDNFSTKVLAEVSNWMIKQR
jgi:hypothetical protein